MNHVYDSAFIVTVCSLATKFTLIGIGFCSFSVESDVDRVKQSQSEPELTVV